MLRTSSLVVLLLVVGMLGCSTIDYHLGESDSDDTGTPGLIPDIPPATVCAGVCVTTAPGSFTGPSIFWFGQPNQIPACPAETPFQGIEGFVDDRIPSFARECLITPTDDCSAQGKVCAPFPNESYALCIHHADKVGCTTTYADRHTLFDTDSTIDVTVCCDPPQLN